MTTVLKQLLLDISGFSCDIIYFLLNLRYIALQFLHVFHLLLKISSDKHIYDNLKTITPLQGGVIDDQIYKHYNLTNLIIWPFLSIIGQLICFENFPRYSRVHH